MKGTFLFFVLFTCIACKKENTEAEHEVQFQTNAASAAASYTLSVNGAITSDLEKTYTVPTGSSIYLDVDRDSANVWLRATIYVDGSPVASDQGYKDMSLSYTVK
jgi:hypothetical protein